MSGKNINFDDKKIKKSIFYKSRRIYSTDDIDANDILVSKKEPYQKRYIKKTIMYKASTNDRIC